MKKAMIVLLALVLLLAGLFFWKGGHHAIVVSEVLEEWLDADAGDQSLVLLLERPGFSIDSATDQLSMTADTFWTQYADDEVYGLSAGGITAYLRRGILYMDTGRAYSLPDLSFLSGHAGRLAAGLLLQGRVTKNGDTYCLTMDTDELHLSLSVTVDRGVRNLTLTATLPDDTALHASLTPKPPQPHQIPQAVADAMVLSRMERPVSLSEPLGVLLPALQDLLPLSGDLELGISSGILELAETVELTIADGKATLSRRGVQVDIAADPGGLSPAALGLLALRSGTFSNQGDTAVITITLPGDATAALAQALVPQAAGLGISFEESKLLLTIAGGRLLTASISSTGTVPFLFTTIPLTFSADLTVR